MSRVTDRESKIEAVMLSAPMAVRATDAWSIARFCALAAEHADDDSAFRSLINIRDAWIDIANECELLADRVKITPRGLVE